ncbi:trichohyalin-like [Acropora millepora]|uniref:trichohyalin-like n=1 Tax=Acropora millepora TaxID=45264 RepID=UPI001CF23A16|nr:trichohyalin-like [Acropora millepora]
MMADRACRSFKPNVFNNSKCQNCFKLKEAHSCSVTGSDVSSQSYPMKQSTQKVYSRIRTVVKSGVLCIANQDSIERGRISSTRWNKRWFVLNSTGTLDYFYYDELQNCSTERLDGTVNLDNCSGIFIAEADTAEPFSVGLKVGKTTHYLKAENRLELDNWSRVLKPFVQASQAYIPRRTSSSSSVSSSESDVFVHGSSSGIGRVPSFSKSRDAHTTSTPQATQALSSRTPLRNDGQHASLQLEKLKDENKKLREQSVLTARQKGSAQILEQELKEKDNRIKQLEKEHSQYKGYQKAVLFQEKELQEARSQVKDLKQQLDEREKLLQQQKGKISIHAKELAEAKADLQEANSIIGIHRANIESLKNELSSLKGKEKLILAGEEPESDQVFSINAEANGIEGKTESSVHLDSKLSMLMQKLKQNERELLMKSRELEKANESRAKVAKYTRSLLQELESKLSSNERKLAETESQLVNKNLELDYEIERRQKVEGENARLFSELELLSEERKKGGLPKEVVELLSTAKKRVALENVEATSTVVQLSQSEPKFDDEQYELSSSEVDLKKKDEELANLRKDLRKLEDKNADLVEKNRELEERLQTVDSELTESLEREIFLQTESETDEGERWNVKEQIVGLEEELSIYKDKVSELQAKISEKELNAINAEVSQSRLNELERLLKSREDELREKERTVAKLEQEHRTQEEAKRDDKLRLEELENKLRKLQDALESERKKLHAKDRELREQAKVMVFREDVERHVGELESELEQKNNALSEWKSSLAKAKDRIAECEEKLREYESGEANRGKAVADDEIFVRDGQGGKDSEDELRKKLTQAEEQIKKYESFAKDNNSKLIASEEKVIELAEELAKRLTVEKETAEWIEGVESNLSTREEELLVTRENLVHKAKELDKEKNGILEVMELSVKYIKELEIAVMEERENSKELERQLDDERLRVRQVVEEMKTVKALQRSEGGAYIKGVNADKIEQRLAVGERNREGETDSRQTDLEDSKQKFVREELKREASSHDGEKLNKDLLEVSGTASSEAEELRLRLTSRVITLQSDISELKASHHVEVEKMRAQHKKELEKARREAILDSSVKESITEDNADMESRVMELESDLKQMADRYEEQMELLKKSHSREMAKLKRSSMEGSDGMKTEVVQLQVEMENMSQKYMEEIEKLKVQHGEELEQHKRDMALVLQASLRTAPSPARDDSPQLRPRIKQLEEEIEELHKKHSEELKSEREKQQRELEEARNDMITVIQAIKSEKYRRDSDVSASGGDTSEKPKELQDEVTRMREDYESRIAELQQKHEEVLREAKQFRTDVPTRMKEVEGDSQLKNRVQELEAELASCKETFEKQLEQRDSKHEEEVNLLKADILVAIQAAQSGSIPPAGSSQQPGSQGSRSTIIHNGVQLSLEDAVTKIDELEKEIEENKKTFKKEKTDLEKNLKKSEAATMFGLNRTEHMSIKIYQMQKEMEAIDKKYEKEIQMYKEAFEREKNQKSQMGDWEALSSENDSLRLEIEELDLKIEELENAHSVEINMYKQKLGDGKLQNVEDLRFKIKSLEDVIEGQKLEHEKELEDLKQQRDASVLELERRYEKELESVKNEQKVLNGSKSKSAAVSSWDLQQRDKKIKDLEFRIEELETLLEVKRRRHKEEIKTLRQRLEDELTKHSEDVRSHRTKVRMLERRKSEHSISFGLNMEDNEYKRMFEEQRSENIKLKFTSEKQKKEVEELQAQLAAETGALKAAEAKAPAVKETAAKEDKPDKPEKPPKPVQFERRAPRVNTRRPLSDTFATGSSGHS